MKEEDLYPHVCNQCWTRCRHVPGLIICSLCEEQISGSRRHRLAKQRPEYLVWLARDREMDKLKRSKGAPHNQVHLWIMILGFIERNKTCNVRDLSDEFDIYIQTLQPIMSRMVEAGLIRRCAANSYTIVPVEKRSPNALTDADLLAMYRAGTFDIERRTA